MQVCSGVAADKCMHASWRWHVGAWAPEAKLTAVLFATGKPIPANQLKKPARNWKAAELQGFALDFSDSDDDTEDAAEEQQKSKRPSQDAAVDSWPLLAAAMQAEGVDTGASKFTYRPTLCHQTPQDADRCG